MPDINKQYEARLNKAIKDAHKQIEAIYSQAILDIAFRSSSVKIKGKEFSLSLYKLLEKYIEARVQTMHKDIYKTIVKSIQRSWALSNQKNDLIVDRRLAGKLPTPKARLILYDPNKASLEAFIKRSEKGLDLSKRIWKTLESVPSEIEKSLFVGLNEGKSATSLATQMKKHLRDPDRLFRRVREIKGDPNSKLKLSRSAKQFHPGKGVYRSSYKNALRLTRTETNISYRSSDFERWQKLPFVVGVEIKLSNNHPKFDICDSLVGKYPKDFVFTGFHPQCICYQVPIMISNEEYNKIERQMLRGEEVTVPKHLIIKSPPKQFKEYVTKNRDRINGWANKPYWASQNPRYTDNLLKKKAA